MALAFFFLTDSCLASRVDRAQLESEVRIDVAVRNGLLQAQRGQKAAEASLGCRLNGWEILYIASLICLVDAWDWQLAHGNMLISLEDHSEARMLCSLWSLNFRGFTTSLPDLWNWSPVWCERHLLEIQWGIWPCLRRQKHQGESMKETRRMDLNCFLHDILIFKCYSDNLLLHISWGHDRCLYPISNTYSPKMVFAFSLHACWLVEYCVSPPGVFNVRWALTRCFVQPRFWDIRCFTMWQFVSLFSSKLYIMSVVDGNPCFFVGSLCNCFILERLEHAFLNVWLSTCRNHHKLGRV